MAQKRLIIVGASSGIGHAIAIKYVEIGWKVGITGRRKELLDELKNKYPGQVEVSCFDVTGNENQQKIKELISALGGLDMLIYNSGYGEPSTTLNYEIEDLTTRTNVTGFLSIVSFAFNYFAEQGYGHIAITSSVAAIRGNGLAPAYSASKAFMSKYAEGLNIKAAKLKKNIVVTDIRPGFMDTKMAKGNRRFWVTSVEKSVFLIVRAIERKRKVAYISRRWWLVAQLFRIIPYGLYRKLG
jgi:short-subunit dehydrogenase